MIKTNKSNSMVTLREACAHHSTINKYIRVRCECAGSMSVCVCACACACAQASSKWFPHHPNKQREQRCGCCSPCSRSSLHKRRILGHMQLGFVSCFTLNRSESEILFWKESHDHAHQTVLMLDKHYEIWERGFPHSLWLVFLCLMPF